MQNDTNKEQLFYDYYQQWIEVYKKGQFGMLQWQNI